MRMTWHIWPGQHWPLTSEQEHRFVEDLTSRATDANTPVRDDVTVLLSMLRCGTDLDQALELAPGLQPQLPHLLGAYRLLASSLQTATAAWERSLSADSSDLGAHADRAARLLPAPVERLRSCAADPTARRHTAEVLRERIAATVEQARTIEVQCAALPPPSPAALKLGLQLFHPQIPGLYADPFYLPDRVSALSPTRVDSLLNGALAPPSSSVG